MDKQSLLAMQALLQERLKEFDEDVIGDEVNGDTPSPAPSEPAQPIAEDVDMSG